jgi:YidC/Oxa1 family membrane protein insertase
MGNAKLPGGAPLVGFMTMPADQLAFMDGVRSAIITWGIPLTILAGIATHLTSRRSVARQREMNIDAAGPQTAIMNKLMLYMFPLFVVVGGPFFPLAILFYWLANNSWTFGQLWVVHRMQDKKALAKVQVIEEAKEATKFSKPKPGAKPKAVTGGRPVIEPTKITDTNGSTTANNGAGTPGNGSVDLTKGGGGGTGTDGTSATTGAKSPPGTKPAPGARPARSPGQQPRKKKNTGRR